MIVVDGINVERLLYLSPAFAMLGSVQRDFKTLNAFCPRFPWSASKAFETVGFIE